MELSRIFYKVDRNSDGKITIEGLTNAYEEAGDKINKNELEEIIKMADFDWNGFIEYDKFHISRAGDNPSGTFLKATPKLALFLKNSTVFIL